MKKVAMIGVGKLGQDCAEVMAAAGYHVLGYDVVPRTPFNFEMRPSIEEAVKDRDLIFIAAPTPHDPIYGGETPTSHLPNKDFDYSIVIDILKEVNKYVNKNQLVILISTVLPGTVRNQLEPCITNARFIYNPYLIAMGTIKWDMVNPEMVIIGTEDGSITGDAKELIDFYKVFMENDPRYEVGTWDEAESIKIFYNTFISTKLALVNMIQDVAETNGNINVDVVTNALAKSTYRIMGPMYMKAAFGDAGACHPRDNIALRYLADRLDLGYDLFDSIMTAREVQAERMALRCLKNGKNITIIGKAYKPAVPYTNGSASMLVGHYIEKHGGNVNYYDINTGDIDLKLNWTEVFLIGYWEDHWVRTAIDSINTIDTSVVIIDPWRKFNDAITKCKYEIIHYGDTRKGDLYQSPEYITDTHYPKFILQLFPELNKYKDVIQIIDAEVGPSNFILRPTELIIDEILKWHSNGKTKFLFCNIAEGYMEGVVDKIHRIANLLEGKIDSKNLFYVNASPGSEQIYENAFNNNLNKTNWKNKISILAGHSFQVFSQSDNLMIRKMGEYEIKEKSKDFLCFNKVQREHRLRLIEKVLENNVLDRGYYSFQGDYTNNWIDYLPAEFKHIKLNKDIFPIKLNITPERQSNPSPLVMEDIKLFDDSYFSIITETVFYKNSIHVPRLQTHVTISNNFITEKTFKTIAAKHPFVMLCSPGTLAELRKIGYKTFSPFIDETYDSIQNDDKRFEAIWKEITRLMQQTPEEWLQWQASIKEIVEYNSKHLFDNTNHCSTKDVESLFN